MRSVCADESIPADSKTDAAHPTIEGLSAEGSSSRRQLYRRRSCILPIKLSDGGTVRECHKPAQLDFETHLPHRPNSICNGTAAIPKKESQEDVFSQVRVVGGTKLLRRVSFADISHSADTDATTQAILKASSPSRSRPISTEHVTDDKTKHAGGTGPYQRRSVVDGQMSPSSFTRPIAVPISLVFFGREAAKQPSIDPPVRTLVTPRTGTLPDTAQAMGGFEYPGSFDATDSNSPQDLNLPAQRRNVLATVSYAVGDAMFEPIVNPTNNARKAYIPKQNDMSENMYQDIALDASFQVYRVMIVRNKAKNEELQLKYAIKSSYLCILKLTVSGVALVPVKARLTGAGIPIYKYKNSKRSI
ncbi:hypothetical protein SARC_00920 [Sphaeroforma arctica JP610]|uniref:Uncharacterized protein n=1 Tax=Sphaeroforma arctica JP610 TaxID=667725 RepID=A0A0L0GD85_9EUKA|nr:hypothetical protein SARC_00920 [Sphaeroforma arctica JP610]KNC86970.1 hypothetical protein SARC_00920 [Sphaeroforma arctica JP610]|eukprot:XP_014160872.1 hypothetical protein SARC_00920 [Sphaeroforma arctica JP610]